MIKRLSLIFVSNYSSILFALPPLTLPLLSSRYPQPPHNERFLGTWRALEEFVKAGTIEVYMVVWLAVEVQRKT
jgi:hypothetical protein